MTYNTFDPLNGAEGCTL